jgi:hypothetical protein
MSPFYCALLPPWLAVAHRRSSGLGGASSDLGAGGTMFHPTVSPRQPYGTGGLRHDPRARSAADSTDEDMPCPLFGREIFVIIGGRGWPIGDRPALSE